MPGITPAAPSLFLPAVQAKAAERQAALLESTLCERMQQCPFKPATNHQRRQDALQRLLGPAPADGQLAG